MQRVIIMVVFVMLITPLFGESNFHKQMRIGDHLVKIGDVERGVEMFRDLLEEHPDDPEVMWRLSRALNRYAGTLTPKEQHDAYEEASNYLTAAIRKNPDIPEAHCELAYSLGYIGLFKLDWESYSLANRIKEELDFTLREDSSYAEAYFLYGMWHRFVSPRPLLIRMPRGLGDASEDGALRSFSKAVEMDPDNAHYLLELARQYYLVGRNDDALKILNRLLKLDENVFNKVYFDEAKSFMSTVEEDKNAPNK